ncbi:hypothetical protein F5984_25560 [Rudanella paleaurantiibacter]|uniref:Competence protein n=1 Tax=Rudanella paleaurantiibacter TaxID=2614655 RepID=A0A7J5TRZ6_9BACT|nr:DUF6035 family protein [Rudanella paleaurantiibacter]KAB7725858.1 hypothetical protein F5984_25560 [Rudanella paleaurantiibacter]
MKNVQFTIPSVLDCETGEEVFASAFFKQDEVGIFEVRRQLEDAIRNRCDPKFKCYYCNQLIKIRGKTENETKLKRMHFAHQRDSEDCPIKTSQHLTTHQVLAVKYNGQKESELHRRTKELVATSLEQNRLTGKGVSKVAMESVKRDTSGMMTWRKPDVSAVYKSYSVVFEIQLSTTFLSVIADREHFYQQNQTYIIWLFKSFSDDFDKQRFTEKDVFYGNNQNAFVFDGEAIRESKHRQDLVLKCLYREPYRIGQEVAYRWKERMVDLHDLTFDNATYKVFFFDVEGAVKAIKQEIDEEERTETQRQRDLAARQQTYEQRQQAYEEQLEEGFSLARLSVHQTLNEIDAYPERRSPLLREFAVFSHETERNLFDLFGQEQGYQLTDLDKSFLRLAFEQERANRSHLERNDLLTCLCLVTCLTKLKTSQKAHRLKKVQGPVLALLSIKLNCVVGQKFSKLIQVAHTVFPGKETYSHLFLQALEHWPNTALIQQDAHSGGKLAKKIAAFKQKNIQPDHSYDDVFKILFPELFDLK